MRQFLISFAFLLIVAFTQAQTADELYNQGLALKKDNKSREALEKFRQAIKLSPDDKNIRYEMAWCQNDLKDYRGAVENLRILKKAGSTVPKVYFESGYAYEKLEKSDSALLDYKRCLELKPDYAGVYKRLGYMAYDKDDNAGAIVHFKKHIELSTTEITDYLFWYRKGFCENATKDYQAAILSLEKSKNSKSDYLNTHLELGYACMKLKRDEEAINHYKKAIEIDPKDHVGYNGIGEVYRDNKKDYAEAMSWYKKTLAFNSTERKANYGVGYCLNSTEKYGDAISYLKQAIASEPEYTAAYVEIGYSYYMTSNNSEALTYLKKAMSLSATNENSRYYAALVYIKQGEKSQAQQIADELKKLNADKGSRIQAKIDAM
ncbi:MAG: TPR Domain containing protein [Bacteroidetes bacterium]|nr:MAG: TPR Domain containing protein [Bacteroidota bacterium]